MRCVSTTTIRGLSPVILLTLAVCGRVEAGDETPWHFRGPFGVAVNSRDVVYVAEINNARLARFTSDGQWLGTLRSIDGYGELKGPFDVAVGPGDGLYVTDTRNHRVLALDAAEKLRFVLGSGKKSARPGDFIEPHCVAVNRRGEIFVSDTFNARIQKFSPTGEFLKAWGRPGSGPGEFLHNGYLGGIACDDLGFVYVRETDGGRIQKYSEDGEHVLTFARRGIGPGELDEGYGCAFLNGTIYCADTFENRIQRFTTAGELIDIWAPGHGNEGEKFNHPVDTAVTSGGDIIVTDWKNNRVLKLDSSGKFLAIWGAPQEDILAYQPPERFPRPCGNKIGFSAYAGLSDPDLEACRKAGISVIYPSFNNQDGDWGIAATVEKARGMGIEVHPSIAMFTFGQNSAFSREHPELHIWKKGAGSPMNSILSWSNPRCRRFRADHLVQQAQVTGVDGIMLDYIRYLGNDLGYEPPVLAAYRERYGDDAGELPVDDPQWMQFRADYVTQFIVELRRKLADLERPVSLSAYLSLPVPEQSMESALQDWHTWARMGSAFGDVKQPAQPQGASLAASTWGALSDPKKKHPPVRPVAAWMSARR